MKTKKILILVLLIFTASLNAQVQSKSFKQVKKEYPFNPDYPNFYYHAEQLFITSIEYKRTYATMKGMKYYITFRGKSSLGSVQSRLGFDNLENFEYYKNLIENTLYNKIVLTEPTDSTGLFGDIRFFMKAGRKAPF